MSDVLEAKYKEMRHTVKLLHSMIFLKFSLMFSDACPHIELGIHVFCCILIKLLQIWNKHMLLTF